MRSKLIGAAMKNVLVVCNYLTFKSYVSLIENQLIISGLILKFFFYVMTKIFVSL